MAMALDFSHKFDVHPQQKNEVGKRAGLQALKLMGHNVIADGPIKKDITIQGSSAIITFDHTAQGLKTQEVRIPTGKRKIGINDSEALVYPTAQLLGFEVCGDDKIFHPATASINSPNKVLIQAPTGLQIKHVRYAFHQLPKFNLFNSAGLPAQPFRTDDFAIPHGAK